MSDVVFELQVTEVAELKLAVRGISIDEAGQLPQNAHVTIRNPRGGAKRRLLIGHTDGGRVLTLVIEQTIEQSTWVVITGWTAAIHERRILER